MDKRSDLSAGSSHVLLGRACTWGFSALNEDQWAIVAHYVFLSYLHDHPGIDYCGYLLFFAVPERGKSRTGKSVTYIAFRGIHLVEMREATIFRYSEYLHGTLFFDLQDVSKKAERNGSDDILLLRAEKGARCCRILNADDGPFNDMSYFSIYSRRPRLRLAGHVPVGRSLGFLRRLPAVVAEACEGDLRRRAFAFIVIGEISEIRLSLTEYIPPRTTLCWPFLPY